MHRHSIFIWGFLVFFTSFSVFAGNPLLAIIGSFDLDKGSTEQTEQLTDMIFAEVSKLDNIDLVERREINKIMKEKEMIAGMYNNASQPLQLAKTLGADYILIGKVFAMNEKIFFNCKISNCKTGKIRGFSDSASKKMKSEDTMTRFSEKTAKYIKKLFAVKKNTKKILPTHKGQKNSKHKVISDE